MTVYAINFFGRDAIVTAQNPDSAGGWNFWAGSTLSLSTTAVASPLSVKDDDPWFDDDDSSAQVLANPLTLGSKQWPAGTRIESEYAVKLVGPDGTPYRLLAVTLGGDAWHTYGFVFVGAVPPAGVTLKVVSNADSVHNTDAYAQMAPACFTPATRIRLPDGAERRIADLQPGDRVETRDCGPVPVRLVLRRIVEFDGIDHPHRPVRIRAGALAHGLPEADLTLSPQHRLLMRRPDDQPVLVAAKALLGRPGVRRVVGVKRAEYLHLVFDRHQVIYANGMPAESFLPGRLAVAGLTDGQRHELFSLFPDLILHPAIPAVQAAHPLLPMREAERLATLLEAA